MIAAVVSDLLKAWLLALIVLVALTWNSLAATRNIFGSVILRMPFEWGSNPSIQVIAITAFFATATLMILRPDRVKVIGMAPSLLLVIGLAGVYSAYLREFPRSAATTDLLEFFAGIVAALFVRRLVDEFTRHSRRARLFLMQAFSALLTILIYWNPRQVRFAYRGHERLGGAWEDPNLAGLLAGVAVILALVSGVDAVTLRLRRKLVIVVLAVVSMIGLVDVYAIARTFSRGSWFGLLVAAASVAVLFFRSYATRQGRCDSMTLVEGGLVLLIAAAIFLAPLGVTSENVFVRRIMSLGNPLDLSWSNRLRVIAPSLRLISEFPIFGTGWGQSVPILYAGYVPTELPESDAIKTNSPLQIAVECGVGTAVAFILGIGLIIRRAARLMRENSDSRVWAAMASVVLISVGVSLDGKLMCLPLAFVFWMAVEELQGETTWTRET